MLKDIYFTSPHEIVMHKTLWADNEIALAKCLNFKYDVNDSNIICDLLTNNYTSVIEFIKESFQRLWNHPTEHRFKEDILSKIEHSFVELRALFDDKYLIKLGYQDKLYTHQKDSLFLGFNKQHNFYALEQGLGKTMIAASLSKLLQIKRTLVICPNSLKHNWYKELTGSISEFNEMYFTILDSNKARTIKAFQERFVIINFDCMDKHMEYLLSMPFGHIIIDEAVAIKSTSTRRFKNCDKVIKSNPTARVSLLSGTPVRNRINDLYAYLKIIGHPLGMNYSHFLREYTISAKGRGNQIRITGAKNTDLLWKQLSNFMIRKKKEDCLDLPPKIYGKLYFELDDYKDEYNKAVKEALENNGKSNLNSCVHSINIVTSKAKIKGVIDFAESIIDQNEKLVIFTGYTEIINILQDHFKEKAVMINGSVNSYERSVRVERFMKDESCMIFLGNTMAAGTGLTLTAASNMIFCDFPFSPSDLVQAEDRIHRIGASKSCNIYYAVANGSIDEDIYSIICDKAYDATKVIDNKTNGDFINQNIQELLISKLRKQYSVTETIQ